MTAIPDTEVDVLAIGAGMGGMCAALFASLHGFSTLLCEKTGQVGGTTATSAGTVWLPGASPNDDVAAASRYLEAETGNRGSRELRQAFIEGAAAALQCLQSRTDVQFRPVMPHPDYHPDLPGWSAGGRAFAALPFDGRKLGRDFALVRPPIAPFMVLGGLMLGRDDIRHFVKPLASLTSLRHVAGIVLRHATDRLTFDRGTRLVMGNALVARLLFSLRRAQVPLALGASLVDLLTDRGRVQGAVLETEGVRRRVLARRGIVLATGGFSHSAPLRAMLLGKPEADRSLAFAGDSGDGINAGRAIGAALGDAGRAAFWMPVSILRHQAGETIYPHIFLDRAKPGLIAVNSAGRRFVDEAVSYHDFVEAMFRSHDSVPTIPAWLVCDRRFIRDYGLGLVHPRRSDATLRRFAEVGYLRTAPSLATLANAIGVDPADLGTSVGLRTDEAARVLRADGTAIEGLYACGNDMDSIVAGAYPGPGITLGPALVFAYRAVQHMAAAPH